MPCAKREDWLGTPTARKAIGPFVFVQHRYPNFCRRARHSHSWQHLSLVQRGHYLRILCNRLQQFRPGELSLLPTEETHSDEYAPGTKCLHMVIPSSFEARLTREFPTRRIAGGATSSLKAACAVALYREFIRPDNYSYSVIEAILVDFMSREVGVSSERSRIRPPWIASVLDYVNDTFHQSPSLGEAAAQVGVHPVYLCRAFSDHLGINFGQYIRDLRVLRAWELVSIGHGGNMSEIAAEAGFADESHFSRTFKKAYGTSPGRYRRHHSALSEAPESWPSSG
jgi:AraC family transcriptional regulator